MLRATIERDGDGLPAADRRELRWSFAVAAVATLWFALAAAWELFGPPLAGHYASSASVAIIAENMLRWHIAGPVWEYTLTAPPPSAYYCHHPWGIFWTTAALFALLGRHDFLCRLAPVLLSAATPPLLYAIGRAVFRPAAGAAAAAAFVVVPIALAFASFNALEVPVIAWSLVGVWGFVRLSQTGRTRYLAWSLAGTVLSLHADWPAFIVTGALVAIVVVRGTLLRPRLGPMQHAARVWTLAAASTVAAAATLLLYAWLFARSGKLAELASTYARRSSGNTSPLAEVLASRRYWIELSFSPVAILLGKVAAVVSVARLFVLRRRDELLPLAYLLMAGIQYVVFREGADMHVFWPHYFAAYFALAMAALVATLAPAIGYARDLVRRRAGRPADPARGSSLGLAALALAMLPIGLVARDGIPALRYARETGGRFNEKGLIIDSDGDKTVFLEDLARRLPPGVPVAVHAGMKGTWSQTWALGGRPVRYAAPIPKQAQPTEDAGVFVADARYLGQEQQDALAARFKVTAVGPFWSVLPRDPAGPIDAFRFEAREPRPWEWYLLSGTEPVRTIVPDPYATWELRTHLGQPADVPSSQPSSLDERRVAHNIAVLTGDDARADALLGEVLRELSPPRARFADGTEIVGTTYRDGASATLTVFVRAGGPLEPGVDLAVRSSVTAPAPLSATMADPVVRENGNPLAIAPRRWKKGLVYAAPVTVRKRPGTEVFWASFVGNRGGRPPAGPERVDLLELR